MSSPVGSGLSDGAAIALEMFAGKIFGASFCDFAGNLFGASFCNTVDLEYGFLFDLTTFDLAIGSSN